MPTSGQGGGVILGGPKEAHFSLVLNVISYFFLIGLSLGQFSEAFAIEAQFDNKKIFRISKNYCLSFKEKGN